jgi:undecaprenyl-diphosphatase
LSEPSLLLYAVLGAVQGLVEWFPLSSSGQIAVALETAGLDAVDAVSTALWIHFGSLLAIVARFRHELFAMARSGFRLGGEGEQAATKRFLIIGTIFTGTTGVPAYLLFYTWFSENPGGRAFTLLVGALLVVTGIVLFLGSRIKRGTRGSAEVTWLDGAVTGVVQGFAVLPGISRSGFTVAALLGRGIDKADALKLSFLLDVPAIMGAMVLTYDNTLVFTMPMALGISSAFVVSYFSMTALIGFAKRIDLSRFCILYGTLAAIAAAIQMLAQM